MPRGSGLGNALNPLISLCVPYGIPLLMLASWRGEPGRPDAPHHRFMGTLSQPLLELLPGFTAPLDRVPEADVLRALAERRSVATWLVPAETLAPAASAPQLRRALGPGRPVRFAEGAPAADDDVLDALAALRGCRPTISTTGHISRGLWARAPTPEHLPMAGSMGFALALGAGVAQGRPGQVLVVDGDGALLMRLGSLVTVGAARLDVVHVVLDNSVHGTTGGQPTAGPADLAAIALASGYRRAGSAGADSLSEALMWALQEPGPTLLHLRTTARGRVVHPRPAAPLPELAGAFRQAVGGS